MGVSRFEDLTAWQRSRAFVKTIYDCTRETPFAKDFGLSDQIKRASVSIMSNIAEGFERARPREFHQFLSTSKASCAEARSLLYVGLDVGYLTESRFEQLMQQAEELSRIVGGLRASVARQLQND